jgi:hypothetical protein
MEYLYDCITELNKPITERKTEKIIKYIESLTPFMTLIQEDINKNSEHYNDSDNNDIYDENEQDNNYNFNLDNNNQYNEYNINNLYSYNNQHYNSNDYSNNRPNYDYNDNNFYDQALISRINNNRKKNMRNYYTTNIGQDNMYDEFIINYNLGINKEDNYEGKVLNRNKTQFINNSINNNLNNKIYNTPTINYFNRDNYPLNNKKILIYLIVKLIIYIGHK